jgi:hypothetical protein
MEACAPKLRARMLTCVLVEAAHRARISPTMEALRSSSPIMEALCLELTELPAAEARQLAGGAGRRTQGRRAGRAPRLCFGIFLCCNRCILVL